MHSAVISKMIGEDIVKRRTFMQAMAMATGAGLFGAFMPSGARAQAGGLPPRGEFTIRGAHVLTMDAAIGDFGAADIHVRDGQILSVGPKLGGGGTAIDGGGFICLPGLIDTHQHMWTSLFRGLVGETREISYLAARAKLGPSYTPEQMYVAVKLAMAAALNSGVTTSNNMHHNCRSPEHADATIRAQQDVGLRGRYSYGVAESQPADKEIDYADIARLKKAVDGGLGDGLITLGTFLRSPGETSDALFRSEFKQAQALDLPVSIDGPAIWTGGAVIRKLGEWGVLGPKLLIVHSPGTEKPERLLLAQSGTSLSSAPFTEMAGLAVMPQAVAMAADGVNVSLSIDTMGSPNDSNMFTIARVVMCLGRMVSGNPIGFNHKTALEMATVNGAKALGLADKVGSLTPGKRADLILVRTTGLNMNPAPDLNPYRQLVCAQTEDVDTVVVDGRILKRGGKLTALDADKVAGDAADALTALRQKTGWPS
jgi:5-methylthioadenosine/S-adenosylhomocysteine deaminase